MHTQGPSDGVHDGHHSKGEDGQYYCQSALRIRTILVWTGKDSADHVKNNMTRLLEEIQEIVNNGLRFNSESNTLLNQVAADGTKAEIR